MSVVALGLPPTRAQAQTLGPLHLLLGASLNHDSNVFRLPGDVDPQSVGRPGRSDSVRSGYIGLRMDQPYSLQRIQLDVTQTAYRHARFTQLDFDALNYKAAWLWHVTPRVNGALTASRSESLVPFSDFQGTQANKRTSDAYAASLNGRLFGGWHVLLGAGRSRQRSSVPVLAEADFESTTGEAGLRYLAGSGSSWGFVQRLNDGEYINRAVVPGTTSDSRFTEHQSELNASWIISGRSSLDARVAWVDRRHANLPERDYAAPTASLSYSWIPVGKLRLTMAARSDIAAASDPLATYTRRDTFSIAPSWELAAKTVVRLGLAHARIDYRNANPGGPSRKDDTDIVDLGMDWTATRNVSLNASVSHEKRSSNTPGFDYTATVGRVGVSLTF